MSPSNKVVWQHSVCIPLARQRQCRDACLTSSEYKATTKIGLPNIVCYATAGDVLLYDDEELGDQ